MAKISYVSLIICCLWISFYQILVTSTNSGEFSTFKISISMLEVFYLVFINTFLFLFIYGLFFFLNKKRLLFSKNIRLDVNTKKLNYAFLLLLFLQLTFLISTGVGRLLSDATHPLSPIFAVFSPEAFFPIYYLLCRKFTSDECKRIFCCNVFLFSSLKLLQGWSGFILIIVFLEFFYRTKHIHLNLKYFIIAIILPFLMLSIGGGLYTYVYQLKNDIRGTPVESLTYVEGVSHLASRLSMLPVAVAAKDREFALAQIFNTDPTIFKEIVGLGRPILPRFIMSNKEFLPLGNDVLRAYYPDITGKTSSNMGIYMYFSTLFNADGIQSILYLLIMIILLFVAKTFIDSIEQFSGQLQFVFFMLLINVVDVASLEIVFGYGFLKAITVFLLCWLFGGFRMCLFKKGLVKCRGAI